MTETHAPEAAVTTSGDREARIERVFDAPKARVWRAHAEPDLLKQWWGRGNEVTIEQFEFEPGGHWRFVEHSPDGEAHGFEGRYREISPMDRIVMTFEWDGMPGYPSIDTLELEDLGDGRTKAIATALFMTGEERDGMLASGMEGGLNESYRALDALLATIE